MPQEEIVITDDNKVQLTQIELGYLESFLKAGDRAGFYLAYHNMTGSAQALEQAKISTFSEEVGGAAFTANTLLQEFFGPQNKYAGIYYLSQKVAEEAFNSTTQNIIDGSAGVIDDETMFASAQKAWEKSWPVHDQLYQFPGNGLSFLNWVTEKVDPLLDGAYSPGLLILDELAEVINKVTDTYALDENVDAYEFFIQELGASGVLATFAGAFGSTLFGKRLSDYEGHAGFTTHILPDSTFKVVTNSNGIVVGIFDNTPANVFDFETLESLAGFLGVIAEAVVEAVIGPALPFLSGAFSWYRRQLSESSLGINGDRIPIVTNNHEFVSPPYPISTTTNADNSTLWGTPGGETLDGSSGKDSIFGGEGQDTLNGGDGDDLLYGGADKDNLYGNAGEDILRGGAGDDVLEGGDDDDILDGGDITLSTGTGDDTLDGGAGNDQLFGGDGEDTLTGGKGIFDILEGGAGNDKYIFNTGDQQIFIRDPDMNGSLILKNGSGETVLGSQITQIASDVPVYDDADENNFLLSGTRLFITTADGEKIIVEDFTSGKLGITLPSDPVEPPGTDNTILGDLAYQDFDPVGEGIQTRTDGLGNLIQIPDQQEAQEDHLFGSQDADLMQSGTLNDLIEGKGGDDSIEGGRDIFSPQACAMGNPSSKFFRESVS